MAEQIRECVIQALNLLKAKANASEAEYDELNRHEACKQLLVSTQQYPFCVDSTRVTPSADANFIEVGRYSSGCSKLQPSSFAFGPRVICSAQPHSGIDFWDMVVQSECKAIVKLTEDLGTLYFPAEKGESKTFGNVKVTNLDTSVSRFGVTRRVLYIECHKDGVQQNLLHFQVAWPEFRVLRQIEPIQEIIAELCEIQSGSSYIVHCRAGIGRAGTFVAIDHIVRRVLGGDLSAADVPATLQYLREQRRGLVETREQYMFVFRAVVTILESWLSFTSIPQATTATQEFASAQQLDGSVRHADAFEV